MHLALFFVVNLAVAAGIGVMAYMNGHGFGGIALRAGGALVALQATYAIWVLAVALMTPKGHCDAQGAQDDAPAKTSEAQHPRAMAADRPRSAQ
jgi:hypothetical protein